MVIMTSIPISDRTLQAITDLIPGGVGPRYHPSLTLASGL